MELENILEKTIGMQEREPLLKALEEAGVPATPVNTVDQVMNDAQTAARGMVDRVQHPVLGEIPVVSTPVKFSNMKVGVRMPAPVRSQHSDEVLGSPRLHGGRDRRPARAEGHRLGPAAPALSRRRPMDLEFLPPWVRPYTTRVSSGAATRATVRSGHGTVVAVS